MAYQALVRFRPDDGRLLVELPVGEPSGPVVDAVERAGARIEAIEVSQEGDRRRLEFARTAGRATPASLVARIADVERRRSPLEELKAVSPPATRTRRGSWSGCSPDGRFRRFPRSTIRPRTARPTTRTRAEGRFGRRRGRRAWVFGEDSGLEVEGLGGGPGVRSARARGATRSAGRSRARRNRRRRSPRALRLRARRAVPDGKEVRGTGTLAGRIAKRRAGARASVRPVFVPDGEDETVASSATSGRRALAPRERGPRVARGARPGPVNSSDGRCSCGAFATSSARRRRR